MTAGKLNLFRYLCASVFILACLPEAAAQAAIPWLPISKEDLDLKDNPLRPGEPAMILYREVQTDTAKSYETHYTRIKIFKDSGKQYADSESAYIENEGKV